MIQLGCVAESFAAAIAIATAAVRASLPSTVLLGAPGQYVPTVDTGCVVVAMDLHGSVRMEARSALEWLRTIGCEQLMHGFGTAFDRSDDAVIGAVGDTLLEALGAGFALVCPSTPSANMTTYMGHLFDKAALSGGPDANLVRALSQQTDGTVGLVRHAVVRLGTDAIRAAAWALKDQGRRFAIVDALDEGDVVATAAAALGQPLVCGTESLAEALAARMPAQSCPLPPTPPGAAAVIAMSSSRATLFQVGQARATLATLDLDPVATPDARALAATATAWAAGKLGPAPVMIAMTLMPDQALRLTKAIGAVAAATLMRDTAALVAKHLADHGVRRLLLAGMAADGEVVRSLGVRQMRVVAEIDRGVPWTHATGDAADMMVGIKPDDAGGRGVLAGAFELLG